MQQSAKQGEPQTNLGFSQCNKNYTATRPLSLDDFEFVQIDDFQHAFKLEDILLIPDFGGFILATTKKELLVDHKVEKDEAFAYITKYLIERGK